ncbi:hypothetical protein [Parafilimonas terrae]|uniref:Uncharacterized protein n=1 Tax=Parafilimonas terrae TaxID=1465490 RepID=A0A1I5R2X3_9BACT|nr:hypothetical protein [Parafilimonas terrae]SFP52839.1 hypothetical protein SAMN05444277_10143 [Parafilimonas terrae]
MKKKSSNKKILKPQQQSPKASEAAHEAAEADISKDFDLTPPPDPAADLDEGELARFEGGD